jgi:hypothetical protein
MKPLPPKYAQILVHGDPRSDDFARTYARVFEISVEDAWKIFKHLNLTGPPETPVHRNPSS